jgi:hypothetical protein
MRKLNVVILLTMLLISMFPAFSMVNAVSPSETLIWSSDPNTTPPQVSSLGNPVTTPMSLKVGATYRIEASEIFWYDQPGQHEADALYYTTGTGNWEWTNHYSCPDGHSFLQINNKDVNWGSFNNGVIATGAGHTYSIKYIGQGEPITLRIYDWLDVSKDNNYCHISVRIYLQCGGSGLTPGFWKNHVSAWQGTGYVTIDSLKTVFGNNAPDGTLMQGLNFGGGPGISGAKQILARAAVAALLNAGHFSDYPLTQAQIISLVTAQFNGISRDSMLSLASTLDSYNNLSR